MAPQGDNSAHGGYPPYSTLVMYYRRGEGSKIMYYRVGEGHFRRPPSLVYIFETSKMYPYNTYVPPLGTLLVRGHTNMTQRF